jgi:hypothetical protein
MWMPNVGDKRRPQTISNSKRHNFPEQWLITDNLEKINEKFCEN